MTTPNNPNVGSQAQRWIARQRTPSYTPGVPAPAPDGTGVLATIVPNQFVGSQAQRWLAKQRAPDTWPTDTPIIPGTGALATTPPNWRVGSQAQRWLRKQRSSWAWPVDTPPSYISPVTPPTGPGLVVRGAYGFVGIQENQPDGTYWRMANFTYLTDSQYISIVLGDEGGAAAQPTILYFHCNSSFTQGAFLSITFNSFTLGSFTRTDNTITYTPFNNGSVSMLLLSAQVVGVQNINNAYTVLVNGQPMLEFTGGSVAMGPSFRSAAVSMSRFTDNSGFVWDSYRLAALSLADYVQPVYTGSGCRISRHVGTSAAEPFSVAGTPAVLVGNSFDTIDLCTADIIANLALQTITVTRKGWYHVDARVQSSNNQWGGAGASVIMNLCLFKNGVVVRLGQDCIGTADVALGSIFGSFDIDCNANDVLQLGVNVQSATLGVWGVSAGAAIFPPGCLSYMTVTLNNAAGSN